MAFENASNIFTYVNFIIFTIHIFYKLSPRINVTSEIWNKLKISFQIVVYWMHLRSGWGALKAS